MMAGDNGVPIRPRSQRPAQDAILGPTARCAQQGARALAAKSERDRARYAAAANRQEPEPLLVTGWVVPARITLALDSRGLEGPEVDTACGAAEPDVDMWELGLAAPTAEQVRLLAEATGYPIAFFYEPIKPGPVLGSEGPIWICGRHCEARAQDVVNDRGVLLYGGEPRKMPATVQAALF